MTSTWHVGTSVSGHIISAQVVALSTFRHHERSSCQYVQEYVLAQSLELCCGGALRSICRHGCISMAAQLSSPHPSNYPAALETLHVSSLIPALPTSDGLHDRFVPRNISSPAGCLHPSRLLPTMPVRVNRLVLSTRLLLAALPGHLVPPLLPCSKPSSIRLCSTTHGRYLSREREHLTLLIFTRSHLPRHPRLWCSLRLRLYFLCWPLWHWPLGK
jgi:hypothetical protein